MISKSILRLALLCVSVFQWFLYIRSYRDMTSR